MTRTDAAAWRSLLFVPAHVERFLARAGQRGADGVILDLEDAVPGPEKPAARAGLAAAVATVGEGGGAVLVRVNAGLREMARDLEAAVRPGVSALVVPKVEEPGLVRAASAAIGEIEAERGLPPGGVRLVLQVETPGAILDLRPIAAADPRVAALALGPEDYTAAMGGEPGVDTLLAPNMAVLLAARAAGIVPLGFVGSIAAYDDLEAYAGMIRHARRLGFRGAMAVHPSQVAVLNEQFGPTEAETAWARRVVEGDARARAEGRGAFAVDGKMVDAPVVRRAEAILASAR